VVIDFQAKQSNLQFLWSNLFGHGITYYYFHLPDSDADIFISLELSSIKENLQNKGALPTM